MQFPWAEWSKGLWRILNINAVLGSHFEVPQPLQFKAKLWQRRCWWWFDGMLQMKAADPTTMWCITMHQSVEWMHGVATKWWRTPFFLPSFVQRTPFAVRRESYAALLQWLSIAGWLAGWLASWLCVLSVWGTLAFCWQHQSSQLSYCSTQILPNAAMRLA